MTATPAAAQPAQHAGGVEANGVERPRIPVSQAFSLGWNVCAIYLSGSAPSWGTASPPPDRLPSPARFTPGERSVIRLGQVRNTIDHFDGELAAGDELLSGAAEKIGGLIPQGPNWQLAGSLQGDLREAHLALARALSAADSRLAKAYHLGVALAATCYCPDDLASLKEELNPYRTARLGEWLADLASLFPDHSSRAVRLSCAEWRRWTDDPHFLEPEQDWTEVRRALARQGEVWRALLSGEKSGTATLELHDYVRTGGRALKNGARLVGKMWFLLLIVLVLLGAGSWLLVKDEGAGATVAGLVSVATAIGVTWKGILGALAAVASKLQQPVWGAALDEEIAAAITELPPGASAASESAREAAPSPGPQASALPLPDEVEQRPEWVV